MAGAWDGSATANWIAAARARESVRPDALFVDPWAERLAGRDGFEMLARQEKASGVSAWIPVRTRFIDDFIRGSFGWVRQVVMLGAGLDTRAYRLGAPEGVRWFEVDRSSVFEKKDAAMAGVKPTCERRVVMADLAGDCGKALLDAGFENRLATVWVAEGVFFYMTAEGVGSVLREAARLTGGDGRFVADTSGTGVLKLPVMKTYLEFLSGQGLPAPFCTDDPAGMMEAAGWGVERVTRPGLADANYGRFPVVAEQGGGDATLRTHLVVGRRP